MGGVVDSFISILNTLCDGCSAFCIDVLLAYGYWNV
jgi:hypothetical protein